jgi:hypothetical protein
MRKGAGAWRRRLETPRDSMPAGRKSFLRILTQRAAFEVARSPYVRARTAAEYLQQVAADLALGSKSDRRTSLPQRLASTTIECA